MTNVLFLCARNRLRSPTAEQVFAAWPGVETASAGLNPDADEVVGPELVEWADLIFVMERAHLAKLRKRFHRRLKSARGRHSFLSSFSGKPRSGADRRTRRRP